MSTNKLGLFVQCGKLGKLVQLVHFLSSGQSNAEFTDLVFTINNRVLDLHERVLIVATALDFFSLQINGPATFYFEKLNKIDIKEKKRPFDF